MGYLKCCGGGNRAGLDWRQYLQLVHLVCLAKGLVEGSSVRGAAQLALKGGCRPYRLNQAKGLQSGQNGFVQCLMKDQRFSLFAEQSQIGFGDFGIPVHLALGVRETI